MKIKLNYLNDEFAIEFAEKMTAGILVAQLIKFLEIPVPVLNFYKNKIALQLWSSSYTIDLKKSFMEQKEFINLEKNLNLNQTVNGDIEAFNLMISQHLQANLNDKVIISRVGNKYSHFRNLLRNGVDGYIEMIKIGNLEQFVNTPFVENDFQKLRNGFDVDGLFTKNFIKANYFADDKSCDEEPLESIASIARQTFDDDSCDYFVTMIFPENNAFTINKYRESNMEFEETNKLYAMYGHPSYRVKLIKQGKVVESEFESLRYSLDKRLSLFNTLLNKLENEEKWFVLSNDYCLLCTPKQHEALINSHLLPPDLAYFNPWEY